MDSDAWTSAAPNLQQFLLHTSQLLPALLWDDPAQMVDPSEECLLSAQAVRKAPNELLVTAQLPERGMQAVLVEALQDLGINKYADASMAVSVTKTSTGTAPGSETVQLRVVHAAEEAPAPCETASAGPAWDAATWFEAFPVSMMLQASSNNNASSSSTLTVVASGRGMRLLCPPVQHPGCDAAEVAHILHPPGMSWADAAAAARTRPVALTLRTEHTGAILKGCISHAKSGGQSVLMWVGTPLMLSPQELIMHGIHMTDCGTAGLAAEVAMLGERLKKENAAVTQLADAYFQLEAAHDRTAEALSNACEALDSGAGWQLALALNDDDASSYALDVVDAMLQGRSPSGNELMAVREALLQGSIARQAALAASHTAPVGAADIKALLANPQLHLSSTAAGDEVAASLAQILTGAAPAHRPVARLDHRTMNMDGVQDLEQHEGAADVVASATNLEGSHAGGARRGMADACASPTVSTPTAAENNIGFRSSAHLPIAPSAFADIARGCSVSSLDVSSDPVRASSLGLGLSGFVNRAAVGHGLSRSSLLGPGLTANDRAYSDSSFMLNGPVPQESGAVWGSAGMQHTGSHSLDAGTQSVRTMSGPSQFVHMRTRRQSASNSKNQDAPGLDSIHETPAGKSPPVDRLPEKSMSKSKSWAQLTDMAQAQGSCSGDSSLRSSHRLAASTASGSHGRDKQDGMQRLKKAFKKMFTPSSSATKKRPADPVSSPTAGMSVPAAAASPNHDSLSHKQGSAPEGPPSRPSACPHLPPPAMPAQSPATAAAAAAPAGAGAARRQQSKGIRHHSAEIVLHRDLQTLQGSTAPSPPPLGWSRRSLGHPAGGAGNVAGNSNKLLLDCSLGVDDDVLEGAADFWTTKADSCDASDPVQPIPLGRRPTDNSGNDVGQLISRLRSQQLRHTGGGPGSGSGSGSGALTLVTGGRPGSGGLRSQSVTAPISSLAMEHRGSQTGSAPAHAGLRKVPSTSALTKGGAGSSTEVQERVEQQRAVSLMQVARSPSDVLAAALQRVDCWQFDIFELSEVTGGRPLSVLAFALLTRMDLVKHFNLDEGRLARFLVHIEDGYGSAPYHNRVHAADVLRNLHVIVTRGGILDALATASAIAGPDGQHQTEGAVAAKLGRRSRPNKLAGGSQPDSEETAVSSTFSRPIRESQWIGLLACYLAAVVHDFEHRGVNNGFLIASNDPLAITYNDASPMENHHVAAAWSVLQDARYDFLQALGLRNKLRARVISMVLATDMKQHFSTVSEFNANMGEAAAAAASAHAATAPLETVAGASTAADRTRPTPAPLSMANCRSKSIEGRSSKLLRASMSSSHLVPVRRRPATELSVTAVEGTGGDRPSTRPAVAVVSRTMLDNYMKPQRTSNGPRSMGNMAGLGPAANHGLAAIGRALHGAAGGGATEFSSEDLLMQHKSHAINPSTMAFLQGVMEAGNSTMEDAQAPASSTHPAPASASALLQQLSTKHQDPASAAPHNQGAGSGVSSLRFLRPASATGLRRPVPVMQGDATAASRPSPIPEDAASEMCSRPVSQHSPKEVAAAAEEAAQGWNGVASFLHDRASMGRRQQLAPPLSLPVLSNRPPSSHAVPPSLLQRTASMNKNSPANPAVPGATPPPVPASQLMLDDALCELVWKVAIKAADLGHLAAPLPVHLRWVGQLEEEMFRQGDREKALGLPVSPLMDREGGGCTLSQPGFFNVVALPLYSALATHFPGCEPMLAAVKDNLKVWVAKEAEREKAKAEVKAS